MNRADRRAIKFGNFSSNRKYYQPINYPQGLELEFINAFWQRENFKNPIDKRFINFRDRADYWDGI